MAGRPTVLSRLTAVAVLVVLAAGGAYLAHALTAGIRGESSVAGPFAPDEDRAAPEGDDAGRALLDAVWAEADAASERGGAAVRPDGRLWGDRLARGLAPGPVEDPFPPPPGATRLLGLPGGLTFYRLAAGDPAGQVAAGTAHYRSALLAAGWSIQADGTSAAQGAGRPTGPGHLLIATGPDQATPATAAVFVCPRGGAAYVLVRLMPENSGR